MKVHNDIMLSLEGVTARSNVMVLSVCNQLLIPLTMTHSSSCLDLKRVLEFQVLF